MFNRSKSFIYQTYYISENVQTYFRLYFSYYYGKYMRVDLDFDNLNILQKGVFTRSLPNGIPSIKLSSIFIKNPTNSTNWFDDSSCLLKVAGSINFKFNIGDLYSIFMDVLNFNFDDTSWTQFEDISTLNPDEYSTSFEDVINLNGKDLWSLYFNIYLEKFQLDSWTPTITINNNNTFTSEASFISRNENDLMGKLEIMNI